MRSKKKKQLVYPISLGTLRIVLLLACIAMIRWTITFRSPKKEATILINSLNLQDNSPRQSIPLQLQSDPIPSPSFQFKVLFIGGTNAHRLGGKNMLKNHNSKWKDMDLDYLGGSNTSYIVHFKSFEKMYASNTLLEGPVIGFCPCQTGWIFEWKGDILIWDSNDSTRSNRTVMEYLYANYNIFIFNHLGIAKYFPRHFDYFHLKNKEVPSILKDIFTERTPILRFYWFKEPQAASRVLKTFNTSLEGMEQIPEAWRNEHVLPIYWDPYNLSFHENPIRTLPVAHWPYKYLVNHTLHACETKNPSRNGLNCVESYFDEGDEFISILEGLT